MSDRSAAMLNTAAVMLPCAVCVYFDYPWVGFGVAAVSALGWTWLAMSWRNLAREWRCLAHKAVQPHLNPKE